MDSTARLFIVLIIPMLASEGVASSPATPDLVDGYAYYPAEREDLLELRDWLSSTINLHSNWTGPPCYRDQSRWIGITCKKWHVISIEIPGIQLTGSLRPVALQNLLYLTNLNLSDNALHGQPPTLKGLQHLQNVTLSGNRLSGSIPMEYAALAALIRLELQDNLLKGTIPSFDQSSLQVFNVSYNFLQGKIPDTSVLQRFSVGSYDHNLELCGRPLNTACPQPAPLPTVLIVPPPPSPVSPLKPSGPKGLELWFLILIATGAVMAPLLAIFCFLCYKRSRRTAISGMMLL